MDGEKVETEVLPTIALPEVKDEKAEETAAGIAASITNVALPIAVQEAKRTVDDILAINPDSTPGKIAKSVLEQPWSKNVGVTPTFMQSVWKALCAVLSLLASMYSSTFVIIISLLGLSCMMVAADIFGGDAVSDRRVIFYFIGHVYIVVSTFRCLWLVYTKKDDTKISDRIVNLTTQGLR